MDVRRDHPLHMNYDSYLRSASFRLNGYLLRLLYLPFEVTEPETPRFYRALGSCDWKILTAHDLPLSRLAAPLGRVRQQKGDQLG